MTAAAAEDWRASPTHLGKAYNIGAADGANIALVYGPTDGGPDDFAQVAHLIAAAPDLVKALEGLLSVVDAFHEFCRDPKRPCGEYGVECPISMGEWIEEADKEAVTKARSALAKAEGR